MTTISFPTSLDTVGTFAEDILPGSATTTAPSATGGHANQHNVLSQGVLTLQAVVGANSSAVTSSLQFFKNRLTATGDLITQSGGIPATLTVGSAAQLLGVSGGLPSWQAPSYITHSALGSLTTTDAGHTQFALLAGRSGGQSLKGGTAASENLTLTGTAHATLGKTIFGASLAAFDETNTQLVIGSATAWSGGKAKLYITGTITSAAATPAIMVSDVTITGAGDFPIAFYFTPGFTPTANVTEAYGLIFQPTFSPANATTIINAFAGFYRPQTGSTGGAITKLVGFEVAAPTYGSIKPATAYGLEILDQGSASITTAACMALTAPSGATNNYYINFVTALDTTAAGTYYGRIKVKTTAGDRYIHVFNA